MVFFLENTYNMIENIVFQSIFFRPFKPNAWFRPHGFYWANLIHRSIMLAIVELTYV